MYLTKHERLAIILTLAVGLTAIIAGTAVLDAINGFTCPIETFC